MKNLMLIFSFLFFSSLRLSAQFFYTPPLLAPIVENAPEIVTHAAVMIDAVTGALLYSKNPNKEIPPASLTKLMTMHLLMNEIRAGRASYDELIPITEASWAQKQPLGSSLMFLEPGQIVTLREILLGLAISSGNDASVAAALRLAPSMEEFARLMTAEARRMGLSVTRFVEASGFSYLNMTTANEFAYFAFQYIKTHPYSMRDFHSVKTFAFPLAHNVTERNRNNPRTISQNSRNSLLGTFEGVDGLKTGFIPASGHNIALTAERDGTRVILVLLGGPSDPRGAFVRHEDSMRILDWAFNNFRTVRPDTKQIEIAVAQPVRLWKGRENTAQLKLAQNRFAQTQVETSALPLKFTSPLYRANNLYYTIEITNPLIAPLAKNYPVGYLVLHDEYGELHRIQLLTENAHERGNIFRRIWHSILLLFR